MIGGAAMFRMASPNVKTSYYLAGQTGNFADAQSAGWNIAKIRCCFPLTARPS